MNQNPIVDVVLPVFRPDTSLLSLFEALERQTVRPRHILLINIDEQYWDESLASGRTDLEVYHVDGREMPGQLHNFAASLTDADVVVYFGAGAYPADDRVIARLLRAMRQRMVKMAFARLLADPESGAADGYEYTARFPKTSRVYREEDLREIGADAVFASNACAAYDMEFFRQCGGFPGPCPGNPAMVYEAMLLAQGYEAAYCANAGVMIHAKKEDREIFTAGFDDGVSFALYPSILERLPRTSDRNYLDEVTALMRETGHEAYLPVIKKRRRLYRTGFFLGLRYRALPAAFSVRFTSRPDFMNS